VSFHKEDWQTLGVGIVAHVKEHAMIYGALAAVLFVFLLGRCSVA
jgi:hypothetical protein